ncbi:MAG: hypothetical protein LBL87_04010 [Ruminococcus sp.]|jgi:hypothetical protein|nr:hypothetical protein [Ruminococcus sp.]
MKKSVKKAITALVCAALAIIALYALSGCDKFKNAVSGVPNLDIPYSAEIEIDSEDLSLTANVKRLGTGIWEMEITSPETLKGLKITYDEDKITSVYDGIITETPIDKIPTDSIFLQIFQAADNAANIESPDITEKDGDFFISGSIPASAYTIQIDGETKTIEGISLPDSGLEVVIRSFLPIT